VTPAERLQALDVLGDGLFPLFTSMQSADQRHCLDVYERLLAAGTTDHEMLTAALIHDAGKGSISGARFGVLHRVLYTAIERWPGVVRNIARWNRGIRSLQHHDARTIELAREFGAAPGVIRLLQAMTGAAADERAPVLKAADDQS
jgi:hypothetical protein